MQINELERNIYLNTYQVENSILQHKIEQLEDELHHYKNLIKQFKQMIYETDGESFVIDFKII